MMYRGVSRLLFVAQMSRYCEAATLCPFLPLQIGPRFRRQSPTGIVFI